MTEWVFAELPGAAIRRDPQETELFKVENAGEGEYAGTDALVREVIQNSMDAGTGDGPVRVRFALHGPEEVPASRALANYFSRLEPALAHRKISFTASGIPALKLGFLVCEDFGTRGLGGDVMLIKKPPQDHPIREDFFWFWRNIGRSGKTGADLGRWGLGKTVYRAASRVGCMFGLTTRACDAKTFVMGQAVLRLHDFNGKEYAPEGFYCSGRGADGQPLPINDPNDIDCFIKEWFLSRTTEPGLSVVVPYVTDALKAEAILRLAVINFFVPIIQGKLIVDIAGDSLPQKNAEIRIDSKSIDGICKALKWNGKVTQKQNCAPPVDFARKSLSLVDQAIPSNLLGKTSLPALGDDAFESEPLQKLRTAYANEEPVAIRVRLSLPRHDNEPDIGELLVFLQRTPGTERFESYFVREGMTITKLNSKRGLRGVRAWVLVEPGPLASLLGDTEGPAHMSWDTSNDERANQTWRTWKGRVTFCSRIIDALAEYLAPPTQDADFDLLSDFFSIENISNPKPRRKPGEKGKSNPVMKPPVPTPRWFRSAPKEGGFRITASKSLPIPPNANLRLSVAYDMTGGNPLNHWSKFDFDFRQKQESKIAFSGKGLNAKPLDGNVLELKIEADDFELAATGFDIHRDLFIRIDEIEAPEEEAK
jgi:hypothetical protein